jgi:hypothetical protein
MDDNVKQILIKSIDKTLSSFNYVNKKQFYRFLKAEYGLRLEDVPENY